IQIEIEKGAYVPRFQRRRTSAEAEQPATAPPPPAESATLDARVADERRRIARRKVVAAVAGVVMMGGLTLGIRFALAPEKSGSGLAAGASTPAVQALWKPFLDANTPLLIAF